MPDRKLWIAQLRISDRTAGKIRGVHKLDPYDVRQSLVCQTGLEYEWHRDPERGLRVIVRTQIRCTPALAVLYPIGDDVYHLGSVYPLSAGRA